MPDLGKDDSDIHVLSDTENNNENGGESPCDVVTTQKKSGDEIAVPDTLNEWYQKAKESGWLPWAVAAGFGILWLRKGNNN